MYRHGWFQIAFDHELNDEVSSSDFGQIRLAVVRTSTGVRVFEATCPHRGADLARGGRFDGQALICPFHGFRVGLGHASEHGFCVREYRAAFVGGLLFVQLSQQHDNGFAESLHEMARAHFIMPGFSLNVRSSADMVVENAFDQAHFRPVHEIDLLGDFQIIPSQNGELTVQGMFDLPPSSWQRGKNGSDVQVPFSARAFSPGIVVSNLGGAYPYTVITSSTPTREGGCIIRLSLALPKSEGERPPSKELCEFLLRRSRDGLEKDRVVWEHRCETAPARFTPMDKPVLEFRAFCARFAELPIHERSDVH